MIHNAYPGWENFYISPLKKELRTQAIASILNHCICMRVHICDMYMHIHMRAASIAFRDSCLLSWSLYIINIYNIICSYVCVHVRASSYSHLLCACMCVYLHICKCGYIYTYVFDDVASNMLVTLKFIYCFYRSDYSVS